MFCTQHTPAESSQLSYLHPFLWAASSFPSPLWRTLTSLSTIIHYITITVMCYPPKLKLREKQKCVLEFFLKMSLDPRKTSCSKFPFSSRCPRKSLHSEGHCHSHGLQPQCLDGWLSHCRFLSLSSQMSCGRPNHWPQSSVWKQSNSKLSICITKKKKT